MLYSWYIRENGNVICPQVSQGCNNTNIHEYWLRLCKAETDLCTVTFFPTCPLFLFPCYFFPTATLIESMELLLIFLIPVFLLGHCYFLSCYFFSYLPTVSFFPVTLFILLPKWTVTFFPVSFFPTCPLLLSFLLLFFLPETVTFFPVSFFPTCPLLLSFLLLFSCYFFSYLKLLLSFLLPFFLLLSFRAPWTAWLIHELNKRKHLGMQAGWPGSLNFDNIDEFWYYWCQSSPVQTVFILDFLLLKLLNRIATNSEVSDTKYCGGTVFFQIQHDS